jgi:hypothetical protein
MVCSYGIVMSTDKLFRRVERYSATRTSLIIGVSNHSSVEPWCKTIVMNMLTRSKSISFGRRSGGFPNQRLEPNYGNPMPKFLAPYAATFVTNLAALVPTRPLG